MNKTCRIFALAVITLGSTRVAVAQSGEKGQLRAYLSCPRRHVNVGEPIWVDFRIVNTSDEPVTLFVPGTDPKVGDASMGLPLAHVFSGRGFSALTIRNEDNRSWSVADGYQPPAEVPVVTVAERSSIGTRLDVRTYYPVLRTTGDYRLSWSPYGGSVESNILVVRVASLKQAEIVTDKGKMTVHFFYEDAPRHVENFIGLAKKGFYNNLLFHRIEPGYFLQGGDPNADGTGIRPDGVKLDAEISHRRQERGMVSMALADDDPDSGSCQFFITNTRVPEWDGRYTIFGELYGEDSFATLDALMSTPTNSDGVPLEKLYIRSIRIVELSRDQ